MGELTNLTVRGNKAQERRYERDGQFRRVTDVEFDPLRVIYFSGWSATEKYLDDERWLPFLEAATLAFRRFQVASDAN